MINAIDISSVLSVLSEKLQPVEQARGGFNIFSVLGLETKEVIICRFLGELLNPNGSHGIGYTPLLKFVQNVLRVEDFSDDDAQQAYVELEEAIDGDRRVDIVIHSPHGVFPIEVKVWAGDQDAQLSDYYSYYKKHYGNHQIYYLTPTGWEPSKKSKNNLTIGEQIILLSFNDDIRRWCEELEELYAEGSSPVILCIKQFVEVIEKMCAKNRDLAGIKEVLGLNNEFDAGNKRMLAAIKLLENKDEIENAIMQNYLLSHLAYDKNKYNVAFPQADDKKIDQHVRLKIISNKFQTTVAWICVATNLYLVAKRVKDKNTTRSNGEQLWCDDSSAEREYFWQYIVPKGYARKTFSLGKLNKFPEEKIEIDEWLADIVKADIVR